MSWSVRGIIALAASVLFTSPTMAQDRLVASAPQIDIRLDGETRAGAWRLDATQNPDIFGVEVQPGQRREACLISGENSLCRTIGIGDQFDFTVTYQGTEYPTRILARPPAAVFDAAYRAEHQGKTEILIPEVYELVNIAIALTPRGRTDQWLVAKGDPYYQDMLAHFAPVTDHPFVRALEAEMSKDLFNYFKLKMNGYAFDFDENGRIVRSAVYDRTGFRGDPTNTLVPFQELMQDFADASNFRAFYRDHAPVYAAQIAYYRDEIDIDAINAWLGANFPAVKPYDGTKVIFSPLVASSQSLTTFESNGYRELQPHVNFPYPRPRQDAFTPTNRALDRGLILFTEMNHGYIDPTDRAQRESLTQIFSDRNVWVKAGSSSDGYPTPMSLFNEYMNWALISLYFTDKADPENLDAMLASVEQTMEGRGFPRFQAFNRELLRLYRSRPAGTPTIDLYPQLVDWTRAHAAEVKAASAVPAAT